MSRHCLTLSLSLLVAGLSQSAFAADLVFGPEYQAGEVYKSELEVAVDQTLTIAGMATETSTEQFLIMAETVEAADDDGATLSGLFETVQSEINIMGISYSFSSENPDASTPPAQLAPLADLLKQMAEAEWTATIDEDGHIESMEYSADSFANLDPALQTEVDLQKNIDDANQQAARLPGEGIEVGATWERTETMNLGSGQEFSIEREFTYAGPETVDGRQLERVDVKSLTVDFTIAPNPALPLSVKSSDLAIETTEGAFWYDPAMGTIVKSTESFHVTGDLELEIAGMALPSQLDLTITSSTKITRE
jgi:hypothetical protein